MRRIRVLVAAELVETNLQTGAKIPACDLVQGIPDGAILVAAEYMDPRRIALYFHVGEKQPGEQDPPWEDVSPTLRRSVG